MKYSNLTEQFIKAFFKVYNALGFGFLEKVYENALFIELISEGWIVEKQKLIEVYDEGAGVGEYYADLIVNDAVIIEVKAQEYLPAEYENQFINYLKATRIEVG